MGAARHRLMDRCELRVEEELVFGCLFYPEEGDSL
jgi:hypothetical protein